MALNRTFVQDEKKVEETTFVEVIVWGKQAEVVGQYCKKGRPLYIEGRLQMDSWEDKQSGEKRSKLRIVAENIQLLGGAERNEESQQPSSGRSERQSSAPSTVTAGALPHEDEDDIPF
jgi:single-strand DNA-binding protein